jgi:two-component system, OmpR family, sensor histidine kinase KdpD
LNPYGKANQRRQYLWGLVLVVIVTLVSHHVQGLISEDNLMLWFLVSVIVAALYWGEGPAVLVAFLSFLALDFGVFHPRFEFHRPDLQYFLSLGIFLGVAFLISRLSNDLRRQAGAALQHAITANELQLLGHDLLHVSSAEEVVEAFQAHSGRVFSGPVRLQLTSPWDCQVEWQGTELSPEQTQLLASFTQQARLALQRLHSAEEARQALLVAERERVQNALLNSLSHDLQTPLASIAGSLQVACDDEMAVTDEARRGLLQLAREQTDRLRRLVTNLLQVTRLDGPGLRLDRQIVDVEELVGVLLERWPQSLKGRISAQLDPGVPELEVDYVLVVNLLQNLLENAHKYSPEGTKIELHVREDDGWVRFDVRDRGPGIPAEELPQIFDKFYRSQRAQQHMSGSGLGLFICKGIVDAHQGRIVARLTDEGSLEISVWLPAAGSSSANTQGAMVNAN